MRGEQFGSNHFFYYNHHIIYICKGKEEINYAKCNVKNITAEEAKILNKSENKEILILDVRTKGI